MPSGYLQKYLKTNAMGDFLPNTLYLGEGNRSRIAKALWIEPIIDNSSPKKLPVIKMRENMQKIIQNTTFHSHGEAWGQVATE